MTETIAQTAMDLAPVAEVDAVNRLVALIHGAEALNVRPTAPASRASVS